MIVGIDLGTTHSLVGAMDAGFPILIADEHGSRLTPSVVHFPPDGSQPIVGSPARRLLALHPHDTIASAKRLIGRRRGESPHDEATFLCPLSGEPGQPALFQLSAGTISPVEVAAHILRKLKSDAERALECPVTQAVITVPAYFNDAQRTATRQAGEIAGLHVARIVNEPTAAALAYGFDKSSKARRIAVYDLGGGTFDISILELHGDVFEVISTNGDTRLGGDDIDRALADKLAAIFNLHNPNPLLQARLLEAAISAKHTLSDALETTVAIPFADGRNLETTITRAMLEEAAMPIIRRTHRHCLRALEDAKLSPTDLDAVLLVGGSTRMPCVRQFAAHIFHREPDSSRNPDEAVALGATILSGILSGSVRQMLLLDVTPLSLGIETVGGLMNVIIPRNTTIPAKAGEMFTNAVAGQSSMRITILQGERELAKDNWQLGQIEIPFQPAPRGQARVGVQFSIDADGILHVLARDTLSGREVSLDLHNTVDVSDEAVEKMINESVEHAFNDMTQRIFTEARLKAEEMLPALDKALQAAGNSLDPSERSHILACADAVHAAIASGDAHRLKQATAELDTATQHLATLLVEQAMHRALERKGVLNS